MSPTTPVATGHQELVVGRPAVTNVRTDREIDRLGGEVLRGGAAPDSPAGLRARTLGDRDVRAGGAGRVALADGAREVAHVLRVETLATLRATGSARLAPVGVREIHCLGALEGLLLDKRSLTLVSLPRRAPADHDR
jgi:hypothetical protein